MAFESEPIECGGVHLCDLEIYIFLRYLLYIHFHFKSSKLSLWMKTSFSHVENCISEFQSRSDESFAAREWTPLDVGIHFPRAVLATLFEAE